MMNKKSNLGEGKGVSNTGVLFAKNVGKAAFVFLLLLIATTFVASAQPCDHNVTVADRCCEDNKTDGWIYFDLLGAWSPMTMKYHTALFNLTIDEAVFDAYCINPEIILSLNDTFNASIYPAEPDSCKNNSIAYILNNWTHSCVPPFVHCTNISAAQSAIWYFWYINDTFCSLKPKPLPYNHTALPNQTGWESRWIPNCAAHQGACDFINASINKSVPYAIEITPSSGSFPAGTPIELDATVRYCAGENATEVTVVFEADTCTFNESGGNSYKNKTSDGKLKATLICNASVDSVTVKTRVKDMKWFEIIDPTGCQGAQYQETIKIVNITDDANFSFYTHKVPALSLPLIILLAAMMSVIAVAAIRKRGKK